MNNKSMNIIRTFLSVGYLVQIFPHPTGITVMATKFSVQGAHYSSQNLDESISQLYEHMKDNDTSLLNLVDAYE